MKPKHTEVGWKKNVDKLLFILASVYLISAIAWLWKNQQQASAARDNNSSAGVVKNRETSESYQTQSTNSSSSSIINSDGKSSSTLASQIIPSTSGVRIEEDTQPNQIISNLNSRQAETEEIISFSSSDTQATLSIPPVPSPLPTISTPPPPPNSQAAQSSPVPVKTPPPPQPSSRKVKTTPTKLNRVPVIKSLSQEEISRANQPVDSSPSYSLTGNENNLRNTLLGIVELEDNSVALFNLNNLTEKVEVGSEVGTTGWLLVGISGKQAILNRNNQSRYLTVGEKF